MALTSIRILRTTDFEEKDFHPYIQAYRLHDFQSIHVYLDIAIGFL